MLLIVSFTSVLQILLFCHETESAATKLVSDPPSPWTVLEGHTITFVWSYILDGTITLAKFTNITDGGNVIIARHDDGNTRVLDDFPTRFNADISVTRAEITLRGVQMSDQGEYEFDVTPSLSGTITDTVVLIVHSPAKFTRVTSELQTVNESANLQLFCEATGTPPPNITWTKVFDDGSNSEVLHTGPTWNFVNISSDAAGRYCCTAYNGAGDAVNHTVRVNVRFAPKITTEGEIHVVRGGSKSLVCQVKAYPLPEISWAPCTSQSKCDTTFLNISNVQTSRANYTCTATNEMGRASATTSLVVGGRDIYLSVTIITNENCNEGASWRRQIIVELNRTFSNRNGYTGSKVLDCRSGSVTVDLGLTFGMVVAEDFVISTFRSAIQGVKFGGLSINASSIVGIPPVIPSTTVSPTSKSTPEPEGKNTLAIVLGVLGGILLLVIIGVCVICCVRMKKKKKESKEVDDEGPQRDRPPRADGKNNTGYNPSSSLVPPTKPPRQGNDQGVEMPTYAQVDKTKKKPKPPPNTYSGVNRPDGREREELQYSTIDHSNQGGSMPRAPGNQLKRPPAHTETHYAELV